MSVKHCDRCEQAEEDELVGRLRDCRGIASDDDAQQMLIHLLTIVVLLVFFLVLYNLWRPL